MPSTLHLAPVGGGKTEFAIDRLIDQVRRRPDDFPTIWVLLATRRQALSFRRRLAEREPQISAIFNVSFFNFYTLNVHLLNCAGVPARRVDRPTQVALLRSLAGQLNAGGELAYFNMIVGTRGFVAVLTDLINELKQNGVSPEAFEQVARTDKGRDIAALYRMYQQTLRSNNLVDPEGEGWLALAELQKKPQIASDVDLLLVDGFDQFTRTQARLLAELARSIPCVEITLTRPPDPATGLLRRGELARSLLYEAHDEAKAAFSVNDLPSAAGERHPDLDRLGAVIFTGGTGGDKSDAIRLIAMPSPGQEVRAVLRAVKSQLLAGIRPEEILIALRDWQRYANFFLEGGDEYGLPLQLHHQPPLEAVPIITVLIDLIELAPEFRRIEVLDILRSPYIDAGLSGEEIDLLDRVSLEAQFTRGGMADWLHLLHGPGQDRHDDGGEMSASAATLESTAAKLQVFFEGITPPFMDNVAAFVRWLEGLIGPDPQPDPDDDHVASVPAFTVNLARNIYLGDDGERTLAQRDLMALNGLMRLLREQLKTDHLLRTRLGQRGQTQWDNFWGDLKHALRNETFTSQDTPRENRVLVTAATEARGLPHQHVYILGLAEGLFPAELAEDPLYLDDEREGLQADGLPLQVAAERSDDRGLFYELISLPRASLTLTRPTVQDGKVWIESHLWRSVMQVFPQQPVESMAVGRLIEPRQAASPSELMLSMADQLRGSLQGKKAAVVGDWLQQHPRFARAWQHILRGGRIENRRLSRAPHDHYSGHLARATTRAEAARRLGPERVFSASQLKDYGLCGFRYFAKRLLKLEEFAEPEAGYDLLQLGSLYHKILEETYRMIKSLGITIREENQERALAILDEVAGEILANAPQTLGFRANVTWPAEQQVLRRRLRALVKLDFSDDSPLNAFGHDRTVQAVEHYFRDVEVKLPDHVEPLRLQGFIDRIDEADGRLLVVDYKTGSTRIPLDELEKGRDFQMMSYALAMLSDTESEHDQQELAGGMFWHLRDLKASGRIDMEDNEHRRVLEAALAHVSENLRRGRRGQFPVHPTSLEAGKCSRYCEYAHLCRMSVTHRYKEVSE